MRSIYNKAFLERRASRDGLDKALRITSPLSWIGLIAVAIMALTAVGWAFLDQLPITVTAPGYLVDTSAGTHTITAGFSGRVSAIHVAEGQQVKPGDPLITLTRNEGGHEQGIYITSDIAGVVREIPVSEGADVAARADVVRISPDLDKADGRMSSRWVMVAFVSDQDAVHINTQLKDQGPDSRVEVRVTLSAADGGTYGHVNGRVVCVDPYVTSDSSLRAMLGADNPLAERLTETYGAVYAVTCVLEGDSSGLHWTGAREARLTDLPGLSYTVRITLDQEHPVDRLFRGKGASGEVR